MKECDCILYQNQWFLLREELYPYQKPRAEPQNEGRDDSILDQ
jgi:hypothetical protein